ncbi:MAG: hypothetical protein JNM88_01370 [Chitinophagaceae bacterium]|nr:hypothetical protein [Chitinophagaceae bacterium]
MKLVKNICFYVVLASAITLLSIHFDSKFLFKYLVNNIIGLLLTLLAINTATLGLIASKIQDILLNHPILNFEKTLKEMKLSLLEQIILVGVSIVTLTILDSTRINFANKDVTCDILLVSVLIYAIDILWDTGKAVFVVIEHVQKYKK